MADRDYTPKNPGLKDANAVKRAVFGISNQPIAMVEWIDPHELTANDFNPNRVAHPQMKLLKISLLEHGWLAPIVVTEDNVVVDGFHRWTCALQEEEIRALGDGKVPIVRRPQMSKADHMFATVRMNRARGSHYVVAMADIVAQWAEEGLTDDEIAERCGMDAEEVFRLKQRGKVRVVTDESGKSGPMDHSEFDAAWAPDHGADQQALKQYKATRETQEAVRRGRTKTKPVVGKGGE